MSDIDLELPEPMKEWVAQRVREESYFDAAAFKARMPCIGRI